MARRRRHDVRRRHGTRHAALLNIDIGNSDPLILNERVQDRKHELPSGLGRRVFGRSLEHITAGFLANLERRRTVTGTYQQPHMWVPVSEDLPDVLARAARGDA